MKRGSLSVEFLGLPGAGKSALCHRVSEVLSSVEEGVDEKTYELTHVRGAVGRCAEKVRHVIHELAVRPKYVVHSARAILATRQRSAADLITSLFNWIFISALLRVQRTRPGVHLFDQGIFQALWSVGHAGAPGAVGAIVGRLDGGIPTPDVVVLVEASIETVEQRLNERKTRTPSRLERRLEPELLRRSASLLQETRTVLLTLSNRSGRPRILTVTNERESDLDVTARAIAADLEHARLEQ